MADEVRKLLDELLGRGPDAPDYEAADNCARCGYPRERHYELIGTGLVCPVQVTTFRRNRRADDGYLRGLERAADLCDRSYGSDNKADRSPRHLARAIRAEIDRARREA